MLNRTLSPETKKQAFEVCEQVAARMQDVDHNREVAIRLAREADLPAAREWTPWGWAAGPLSIAIFLDAMDRVCPSPHYEAAANAHVVETARLISDESQTFIHSSLFHGLSGTLFCLHILSRKSTRYQRLISSLEGLFFDHVFSLNEELLSSRSALPSASYDLISGIVGVGCVANSLSSNPKWGELGETIVNTLATRIMVDPRHLESAFFSAPSFLPEHHLDQFPEGYNNLGLAHGTAGVMALLAQYVVRSNSRRGTVATALSHLARFHLETADVKSGRPYWPLAVDARQMRSSPLGQFGWCYGSAGHLLALMHASVALRDTKLQRCIKAAAMDFLEPDCDWKTPSPIICHGVSGGLIAVSALESCFPELGQRSHGRDKRILNLLATFAPETDFGYTNPTEMGEISSHGLLEGAAGVGMTLLSQARSIDPLWSVPLFAIVGRK